MSLSARSGRRGAGFWGFIVLMLVLTALFVVLGAWQVMRLGEKEALIAQVAARLGGTPETFSSVSATDERFGDMNFRPLALTGHYLPERTVLVFTSLAEPKGGDASGPGYWVMTPFVLRGDGTVWVNRGFVPEPEGARFATGAGVASAARTITGIARDPEAANTFTPAANAARRVDYVRDPQRLSALAGGGLDPVAPFTLDLPAGPPGALPQGGETVVEFPNNHLGYAITWFGFALLTPIMLAVWILRQRRAG